MNLLIFFRTGILAALGLALCLWLPDVSGAFGPGTRTPTVKPENAPSRPPDFGARRPRPDSGFHPRPQVIIRERFRRRPPPAQFFEPEEPGITIQQPPRKFSRRVEKQPLVKLAKPRVPYLTELAMEIEQSVIELVRRDPVKAIRRYEQALREAARVKNPKREMEASTNLGHTYYLTGRFAQAAASYVQSADISRRQGDPVSEGIALRNLGATLTASGEYGAAEERNLTAFETFKSTASAKDAQMTLNNLGVLEKNRGRYRGASAYYEKALEMSHEPRNVRILTLRNFGNFRKLWGEYEQAVDNYTAYGNLAASLGSHSDAAEAFLNIGSVYARQGLHDRALAKVRQAVEVQSKARIDTDWSKKLMGDLLLETGRPNEAEHYITEAGYNSSAGWLHLLKSQPQTAKKDYERLLDAASKEQNYDEMFTAHTGLGKVYEAMEDYARAEHHYAKAVSITEEIRAGLLLSERRNFFAEKVSGFARSEPAKGLARVTLKQNNPIASIYAGEVTKAREFADNLSQKTEGSHFNVPLELLEKEAELTNKLAALRTALYAVPKALDNRRFTEMVNQIGQEESKQRAFVKTLCGQCKEYCAVRHPQPVGLRDSSVSDQEYVLLFDVLGDSIGTMLLKGKRVIRSYLTPWHTVELEKQVRRLREPFERVQLTKFSPELARMFYDRLLGEALKSVPPGSSVTIIPDGPLALLPFEALVTSGKPVWKQSPQGDYPAGLTYVADLYSIAYYQSLTAMTLVRSLGKHKSNGNRLLVMADPVFETSDERLRDSDRPTTRPQGKDRNLGSQHALEMGTRGAFSLRRLPETEKLGNSLKELVGTNCELYMGLECSKLNFLDKFGRRIDPYRAVIFGTHGFAANDIPGIMEPVLVLTTVPQGTDGLLTMTEVAGLTMDVDIAALTACKTGLGMRLAGEGVLSMGRAFQCAGARSVIMSLWSVAERPSILLMEEFFKGLSQGSNKLTAWKNARAHVREEGFEHPFFWASFILVGEPK
jgi:CHAT domain-containing protein/Tfp pilus assembly protein PilF